MKYIMVALAITAISAQDLSEADIDNFLDESTDLPCTPKPCVPICKPTTKYMTFGAFKLPYTENVCVPDKKCEAVNAACIKTLQAAMKDAAAKEAALKAASAAKSKAGASKAAKDKAAAAKKAEADAAKKALDLAKAAFTKAEQEAAAAKAASVAADKSFKAKDTIMQKALGVYEGERKNHLAAVAAYDGAKSDAAKAAAAYDAAVNAHCTAEAQHAAAVRKIGHGHLAQKNCAKYAKSQTSSLAASEIRVGDRFIQLGKWRLGDADGTHFSIAYKSGTKHYTAVIFRKDGTVHNGPRRCCGLAQLSTWGRPIKPSRVTFGQNTIQIGDWRLGTPDGTHFSISHKDGRTAMIFRKDGTVHPGPRSCCGLWQLNTYKQSIKSSNIKFAKKTLQIGDWRLGDKDGAHFSFAHKDKHTAMIYRSDGTVHGGPRRCCGLWQLNCYQNRPVVGTVTGR